MTYVTGSIVNYKGAAELPRTIYLVAQCLQWVAKPLKHHELFPTIQDTAHITSQLTSGMPNMPQQSDFLVSA